MFLLSVLYDQYRFSVEGYGCRPWADSVLILFQTRQITAAENEVQAAREALRRVWDSGSKVIFVPQIGIIAGRFY